MASSRGPGRPSSRRPGGASTASRRPRSSNTAGAGRSRPAESRGRQGPRFTTRAVVLLSVVLLLVASYTSALHAWWEQRGEIQAAKAEIVMRRDAIGQLKDTRARFNDPAFIEQQARARFGWVMPGEVGYRVIGSDGSVKGDVPTLDEPPSSAIEREWYDTLWGSVEQAGKKPEKVQPAKNPDEVLKKQ